MVEFLEKRGLIRYLTKKYSSPIKLMRYNKHLKSGMILIHGVYLNKNDLKLLEQRNIYLCICPNSNLTLAGKTINIDMLVNNNVKFILGTDSIFAEYDILNEACQIINNYNQLDQPKRKKLSRRLLRACTYNAALALDVSNEIGSLDAGKKADFVVIEVDSNINRMTLEEQIISNGTKAIVKVICDGVILS